MATTKKLSRQRRALSMLENTLKSGVKTSKDGKYTIELSNMDVLRISKEIESLKNKLLKG